MGSWGLIGKDLTELSTVRNKDPTTWKPWTGGNWSILGMLNTLGGIINRTPARVRVLLDEPVYLYKELVYLHIFNIIL